MAVGTIPLLVARSHANDNFHLHGIRTNLRLQQVLHCRGGLLVLGIITFRHFWHWYLGNLCLGPGFSRLPLDAVLIASLTLRLRHDNVNG
jgi:hypothetical protein